MPSDGSNAESGECWICYDTEREGEIIQPCDCKGGMRVVHHDCLKTWLLEVCFTQYIVVTIVSVRLWLFCCRIIILLQQSHVLMFFSHFCLQLSDTGI